MTKALARRPLATLTIGVALIAAACAGSEPPSTSTSSRSTGASPAGPDLKAVKLGLSKLNGLVGPTALAVRPGDDALYVAEKTGRVRRVAHGQTTTKASADASPVLDLSGEVSTGSEQGLLGLTFSPDGARLYVDYTDRAGDTQVVEYAFGDRTADPVSRRVVLSVHQPYTNHNGGEVAFGPDAKLYVGLGDGGSENDPDMVGQNLGTPLSKILRIDPAPSGDKAYTVPEDNPFVGRPGVVPETFEWGLRNPWRFSWDRRTNDLWIGDVGQDRWEEIDFRAAAEPAGANFGWSLMDATHPFHGTNPPDGVLPIVEYTHDNANCAVTGGYVYRGTRIPALQGVYLYGDYCSGKVWGLVEADGKVVDQRELDVGAGHSIFSFGEDAAGELYLLAADGLYRIHPA
ncbi:MAG: PQQ-dependent sugar dehydrogenase [Acidimicrobiales bacterium]